MSELKWQEPPPGNDTARKSAAWREIADQLRGKPGAWALIAEGVNPSLAMQIRHGRLKAFQPAASFDATTRDQVTVDGKQRASIYARYIGGESS